MIAASDIRSLACCIASSFIFLDSNRTGIELLGVVRQVTDLNHVRSNGSIYQENRYLYDSDGNITSHWTSGAGTTSYSYDNGDRLERWTNPANGKTYEYNYNADDDLTSVTTDVGGQSVVLQSFAHDAANQVTTCYERTGCQVA